MTLSEAKNQLIAIGYKITFNKDFNEYRLVPSNGKEAQAYYTDDLADAIGTARFEVNRIEQIRKGSISVIDSYDNRIYWRDVKDQIQDSYNNSADAQGISTKIDVSEFDGKRIISELRDFIAMSYHNN